MMKIFGAILVIAGSGGYGLHIFYQKKCRIALLQRFSQSLNRLIHELRVLRTTLPEAFLKIADIYQENELKNFYVYEAKQLMQREDIQMSEIWNNGIDSCLNHSFLTKKDYSVIKRAGTMPLDLDVLAGTALLEEVVSQIDILVKESQEELSKKQKLYQSAGFLLGAALVLLLV